MPPESNAAAEPSQAARPLPHVAPEKSPPKSAPKLPTRIMRFPFSAEDIPRYWFWNSPHATHVSNAVHMIFPEGERFFIRSVKHYMNRIDDPELRAQIRGFFGQEGSHGHEHERFIEIIEAQGYDTKRFLELYHRIAFEGFEKHSPPILRLSVTVACEHFTASLAANGLESDFLDGAHPLLRDLMRWHAAEEIEHKAVAFEVLRRVDPRYSVRIAGLFLAGALLSAFWMLGAAMLMEQEKKRGDMTKEELAESARRIERLFREKKYLRRRDIFKRAFLDYLRPSFHPNDEDNYHLARKFLESIGRADA